MTDGAAVITDIHANLPALQAAIARIDELGKRDDLLRASGARLAAEVRAAGLPGEYADRLLVAA